LASRSSSAPLHALLAHYDELLATWLRKSGSRHEAEDIAHDAVVRVLEADRDAIQQPRAYLHQTARNAATDAWRRSAAHEMVSLDAIDEPFAADGDPAAACRAAETVAALETALLELPLKCRQVFAWQRLGGMSQEEIAGKLGLSKNSVEKYMIRAMRHLRDRMVDFDPD
jgi:RNA polymerase sigma-70 factor (ECF subfamily)